MIWTKMISRVLLKLKISSCILCVKQKLETHTSTESSCAQMPKEAISICALIWKIWMLLMIHCRCSSETSLQNSWKFLSLLLKQFIGLITIMIKTLIWRNHRNSNYKYILMRILWWLEICKAIWSGDLFAFPVLWHQPANLTLEPENVSTIAPVAEAKKLLSFNSALIEPFHQQFVNPKNSLASVWIKKIVQWILMWWTLINQSL